ncbi:MAG: hypothetical protein M1822_001257 [Bathelium mastoideum]|nr:MAG: hypothetical protein M1822_001257 [Bathelium mastoideum]
MWLQAERSVYPFHDGRYEDFEKVFTKLIEDNISDGLISQAFFPVANALIQDAEAAESRSDLIAASGLYKRASVVLRIARFPIIASPAKRRAWTLQKQAYLKAASLWDAPIREHAIPHIHAAGGDLGEIPIYARMPPGAAPTAPCPAILLITGLDGHRPDNTVRTDEFLQRGWASVIIEIPGTGDCPAERNDAKSPDRLFSSVLDWMQEQRTFNMKKVVAWGLSAGGYYAIRSAGGSDGRSRFDRLTCGVGLPTPITVA